MIILLCVGLLVAGCGDDDSSSNQDSGESPAAAEQDTALKPEVKVPAGAPPKQLQEKDLVEGSGPEAKAGDKVTVDYVGVGYGSGEQFDASWDAGEAFTFTLGAGEVIEGWDQGIVGMKAEGRRELTIPPDLAYGPTGSPPAIGPNETLIFVVDLRRIE